VHAFDFSNPAERSALLAALKKYKAMYSPDGTFSTAQIRATEQFFHEVLKDTPAARSLEFNSFIVDKWAGRRRLSPFKTLNPPAQRSADPRPMASSANWFPDLQWSSCLPP